MKIDKTILTVSELADFLGVHRRTVLRRLKNIQSGDCVFKSWVALDTNPNGQKRQWRFERLQLSEAA